MMKKFIQRFSRSNVNKLKLQQISNKNFIHTNFISKKYYSNKSSSSSSIEQQNNIADKDFENIKKYNYLFKLNNRAVVSVTGLDASSFLQSMTTNDMKLLDDNNPQGHIENGQRVSIFTSFLNPKGRVLYDAIIIKSHL